jgi:hypothetical protein
MSEGMDQRGQRNLTATGKVQSWVGTKYLVFCSGYNVPTAWREGIRNSCKPPNHLDVMPDLKWICTIMILIIYIIEIVLIQRQF